MKSKSLARIAAAAIVLSALGSIALPKMQAQSESVLYNFCSISGCNDGGLPNGPLTVGWYGNFYGATQEAFTNYGVVFGLYPEPAGGCDTGSNAGNGWCEFVLYSFCSIALCADGAEPKGNVAYLNAHFNRPGNLYGTTSGGGANLSSLCVTASGGTGCGTVFEIFSEPLTPPGCPSGSNQGNGGWCETVLYNFCSLSNCADGIFPSGNLVEDSAGNLYGTVANGVFELSPNGGGGWNETLIYQPSISVQPGLAIDAAGALYGATLEYVFKLSLSQDTWVAQNIHTFSGGSDGRIPNGPPAVDSAGNVYGTTYDGGSRNHGTVWKLIPVSTGQNEGTYSETIVYSFTGEETGQYPGGGVTLDSSGNIYGTTTNGGGKECSLSDGCGTVFKLRLSGTTYKYKLLGSFDSTDGAFPYSSPIFGSSGDLYGVTFGGGSEGYGTLYELTP
jgi:uncharacterized repeat protein (TIGR03803 family)